MNKERQIVNEKVLSAYILIILSLPYCIFALLTVIFPLSPRFIRKMSIALYKPPVVCQDKTMAYVYENADGEITGFELENREELAELIKLVLLDREAVRRGM